MGQWVVTVAGIVILSVLCDVILPDGQTRKYIKTIIGIVVTVVMLQPIIKLADNALGIEANAPIGIEKQIQQSYLNIVDDKQLNVKMSNIKSILNANGIEVKDIEISKKKSNIVLKVNINRSEEKERLIKSVVDRYFVDYDIGIEWLT